MLEKLRSGEPLTAKEKLIHDQGLVSVLRQIHGEREEAPVEAAKCPFPLLQNLRLLRPSDTVANAGPNDLPAAGGAEDDEQVDEVDERI